MKRFMVIVNGWKPLTIITKRSILVVAAALDPPLVLKKTELTLLQSTISTSREIRDTGLQFQSPGKKDEEKEKVKKFHLRN